MPMRNVCIVLYPGCHSLDVTGPYEIFATANRYLQEAGKAHAYRLTVAGCRRRTITTESGLRLQTDMDLGDVRGRLDTLLVPGGDGRSQADQDQALLASLRRLARTSRRVASVCTGTFLLAAAGLLDGRRVTTHWAACRDLAQRYPRISVDAEPIYVRDGNIYTSAGVTAGIDLALALVEADLGREIALAIARYLVLFLHRPANQRQFSAQLQGQIAERDRLRDLQGYISDHLNEDLNVDRLAELTAMSPRHFARCFKAEVGCTPARYVTQVRLESARRLLEEGKRPIESIAIDCGFGTAETLRRTFQSEFRTAPREYRQRFQIAPDVAADIPHCSR